ncbi:MAG: carboxymuconolactone decarboxylase family protein [Fischerella sp.]|nr:carboxymuconolactone decarboxylase family protein [Fischerella sp.]
MNYIEQIKSKIPDYAKDIRLNFDTLAGKTTFNADELQGLMLAAAFATGNRDLTQTIQNAMENEVERTAALTAASLMSMNNVWYPYTEMTGDEAVQKTAAGLRMNAYATYGGTTKERFEAYALAASIVGKCHFCVKNHYDILKKSGYTTEQLKDIGRVAAVINSVSRLV